MNRVRMEEFMRVGNKKLFLASILLFLAGCATYQERKIDVHPVMHYPCHVAIEGVWIAADPYDETEKAETGFDVDLTSSGFCPVHLIFRNDTNTPVQVRKDGIRLYPSRGGVLTPIESTKMWDQCKRNALARLAILSPISIVIGVAAYLSAVIENRKMREDWQQKEFPDRFVVYPGREINGFVYYRYPDGILTSGMKLRVESERLDSGRKIQFELIPGENRPLVATSPAEGKANVNALVHDPGASFF